MRFDLWVPNAKIQSAYVRLGNPNLKSVMRPSRIRLGVIRKDPRSVFPQLP